MEEAAAVPERMVKANGIDLWTEDFGRYTDPPILLIWGASGQGISWPEEFVELLVAGGFYVIRYDNRDTGLSSCFDFAKNPYTVADMSSDAVGLLDAYGITRAHVVGISLGGIIGQQMAIDHPHRLLTLTSIISTPAGSGILTALRGEPQPDDLPPPTPEFIEASAEVAAVNPQAASNHIHVLATAHDRWAALSRVTVPTLVVHGTEDPALPSAHGVATAGAIPGARLHTIHRLGHEFPPVVYGEIAELILSHARRRQVPM